MPYTVFLQILQINMEKNRHYSSKQWARFEQPLQKIVRNGELVDKLTHHFISHWSKAKQTNKTLWYFSTTAEGLN